MFYRWNKAGVALVLDFNPQLAPNLADDPKGGPATIEDPTHVENVRWQTRPSPLAAYENALADALQAIFADEIYALGDIVERLNQMKIAPPAGSERWTDESFRGEIARLAG
jgi:hypothetical protein